jgi:hypothetical protein
MTKLPYTVFLEIEWEDAASNEGWVSKDEDTSPVLIVSRGWLIKENARYLTLANSIHKHSDSEVGGTQTIPCGMIRLRRELKVTNARSKLRHKVHSQSSAEEIHREPSKG